MSQKRLLYLLAGLVALGLLGAYTAKLPQAAQSQTPSTQNNAHTTSTVVLSGSETSVQTNALVVRVVDGDTIEVRLDSEPDKDYKVRFLGVNTPETVDPRRSVQCFGKEASDFSKHVLSGQRVNLQSDPQADDRDKYDRLLRNVILSDGTDFNAKLVEEGYAQAYLDFPLNPARKVLLRQLERQAKEAKRGLWNSDICPNG